ncbi:MAG TPA: signal peptide peptidase SppA [Oscillatoriaceae cyanobacterium]
MTREAWIAGALVLCCGVAAIGSWFTHQPTHAAQPAALPNLGGDGAQVAELDIQGMITDADGGFTGSGTSAQAVLKALKQIRDDGAPVLLLNVDSPGGTAAASQAIYEEIMRLRHDKHVKVVAAMGDLAASGAYYISAAADEIVANPATLTGSIGVIMHTQNLQGLMGKLGITNGAIKSGAHKDIGSPFRPMTPSEQQLLQGVVNDTYAQFLDAVSTGRHIPLSTLKPLADGRIFTGRQALPLKLVDKLGNLTDAENEARRLGGLKPDAGIKDYTAGTWKDFVQGLFSQTRILPLGKALAAADLPAKTPLMVYE